MPLIVGTMLHIYVQQPGTHPMVSQLDDCALTLVIA